MTCGPSGHEPCTHDWDPVQAIERRYVTHGVWYGYGGFDRGQLRRSMTTGFTQVTEERLCRACKRAERRQTASVSGDFYGWRVPDFNYAVLDVA